jgi:hypothetical protein
LVSTALRGVPWPTKATGILSVAGRDADSFVNVANAPTAPTPATVAAPPMKNLLRSGRCTSSWYNAGQPMGAVRTYSLVKLFCGVLVSRQQSVHGVVPALESRYGPTDLRSPTIPFTTTDYYRREMGSEILRVFLSFDRLIDAAALPGIKNATNAIEADFARADATIARPLNLDPGYLENAKIVLASTKNFYHRQYLGEGIFGEVTLHFRNGAWEPFPWTYTDYRSAEYHEFFHRLRRRYREQLRAMCLLKPPRAGE